MKRGYEIFDRHYEVPSHVKMDWYSYIRLERDRDGTFRVCYRYNGYRYRKSTGTNSMYKAARFMSLMLARCDISSYHGPLINTPRVKKAKRSKKRMVKM